ncbi:hypothetical protein DFH08DRAFT_1077070 [Mycena albidolilacea]|uniref:GDP/GTP exchange factor Sec2 N-terminal domain-containing protein n=1 Tax=Mycena albidolilacea TaxID=1033008 RepID=A0AAD7EWU7_9AGAR|nr:hypothetical protein DFH08DRAFT_1077070 [Mycena albidolilacea]
MLHFPSALQNGGGSGGVPRRTDSLNATQQKTPSHPLFLTIEQELHDARRVGSHGQEEDLRSALNMVINRVTELSSLLSEAYKSKAELEVQLNVARSNLQLVIANNEMLEEALKSGGGRDVGWRRASTSSHSPNTTNSDSQHSPASAGANESPTEGSSNSRFFKTFFNGSSSSSGAGGTRPGTPTQHPSHQQQQQQHLTSPSLPSLHTAHSADEQQQLLQTLAQARQDAERERQLALRERKAADKARADAAAAARDKIALEGEIESLSQALFEEANRMVAGERMRAAAAAEQAEQAKGELELARGELGRVKRELGQARSGWREEKEEAREAREEKEALKRALRIIEGENVELRSGSVMSMRSGGGGGLHSSHSSLSLGEGERTMTRSRSSSEVGLKSPPAASPQIPYLPSALPPASSSSASLTDTDDGEPITFAPTGLGLPEAEDREGEPTPRRAALAVLPGAEWAGAASSHSSASAVAHSSSTSGGGAGAQAAHEAQEIEVEEDSDRELADELEEWNSVSPPPTAPGGGDGGMGGGGREAGSGANLNAPPAQALGVGSGPRWLCAWAEGGGAVGSTCPHIFPSTTSRGVLRTPTPPYTRISSQSPHLLIGATWLWLPIRAYASRSPHPHPGPDPSPPPSLIGRLTPRVHTSTSTCDPSPTHYTCNTPHLRTPAIHTALHRLWTQQYLFLCMLPPYICLFSSSFRFYICYIIPLDFTGLDECVGGLGFTVGTAQGFMASLHLAEYPQLWSISMLPLTCASAVQTLLLSCHRASELFLPPPRPAPPTTELPPLPKAAPYTHTLPWLPRLWAAHCTTAAIIAKALEAAEGGGGGAHRAIRGKHSSNTPDAQPVRLRLDGGIFRRSSPDLGNVSRLSSPAWLQRSMILVSPRVAGSTVLVFEHISTFSAKEVKFVWKRRLSLWSVLYVWIRYFTLIVVA